MIVDQLFTPKLIRDGQVYEINLPDNTHLDLQEDEQLDELWSWKDIQKGADKVGKGAQKFTKNLSQTGDAVAGAANSLGGAGKELGKQLVARPVGATYNAVKGGLGKAADVAKGVYGDVKQGTQAVGQAASTVGTDVGNAGTAVGKGIQSVGRGAANVAGGTVGGLGSVIGGATTGLGRAGVKGFNTGVQNVGGNAVDRAETNIFTPKSDPVEIQKQIDLKKQEITDLETELKTVTPAIKTGGGQTSLRYGINPTNGKPFTATELDKRAAARTQPATTDAGPGAANATSPEATPVASIPAPIATTAPSIGQPNKVSYGAGFNKPTATKPVANFGAMGNAGYKPATPAPTTANLPPGGGKGLTQAQKDYIKTLGAPALPESRIAIALKKPVAEMLQMVETKEDVQRIKQFIDQTFTKYGAVNESAFEVRNMMLEHVTQVGAQRRREHARKG
jgi:hypothetical protein